MMRVAKRLTGLGLAALGVAGIIVCLIACAAVWIFVSRAQQLNAQGFNQAEKLVVEVDRRAARAVDAVGQTRDLVDALKRAL